MRILIIISPYTPAHTPNTMRWQPLACDFVAKGHQVSVLTTLRSGFPEQEEIDGVKVFRAGHHTLLDKVYNLTHRKRRRHETGAGSPRGGLLQRFIQKVVNRTWRRVYWPDGTKLFLKPGVTLGKQLVEQEEISHIISVGIPFTCHWIAKSLKDSYPQVHWHMDIQDPFSYSKAFWVNNFEKYAQKNIDAERQTFSSAQRISVTNEAAGKRYKALFPDHANKLQIIPPLWHKPEGEKAHDIQFYSKKIHIGYFGSFYENVRSPLKFLKFLKFLHTQDVSLIDKVQFHFVGQTDRFSYPMFELYPEIRRYMILYGFKTRSEAYDAMSRVDILMNVGNTTDYHLPSKVVDYLASGKPILNITSVDKDSTTAFFRDKSVSFLELRLDENKFKEQARLFLNFVLNQDKNISLDEKVMVPYTLDTISEVYLEALKKNNL